MNATHDDRSEEPRQPGLTHNADEEKAAPGLTRNKADGMTPGEILREGRLAHDYSVDDLCAQTKLSAHTVEALEDNDFQSLSQPVFARGYYRQCAKVLDLDVERLMAAYTAVAGDTPQPRIDRGAVGGGVIPQDVTPGGGFPLRGLFLALIAIVVVIGAVMYLIPSSSGPGDVTDNGVRSASGDQNREDDDTFEFNSSNDDQAAANGSDRESSTSVTGDAGDSSAPDTAGSSAQQARTGRQPGGRNVNQSLGITPPDRSQGTGRNSADSEKSSAPAVAPNHLVLTFNKRSWVRVTDADGNRMASGIFEAGDTKAFDGKPPYKITLGFAPGVRATIGGQAVDITGQTSGGVAHLTVQAADKHSD